MRMAFLRVGRTLVAVHNALAPSDEEWNRYLELCRGSMPDALAAPFNMSGLVFTDGGGPTTPQRAALLDVMRDARIRSSVITTSALVRGIVTALSWFSPSSIRAFAPRDWRNAQKHLALDDDDWRACVAAADNLARDFGSIAVLKAMTED